MASYFQACAGLSMPKFDFFTSRLVWFSNTAPVELQGCRTVMQPQWPKQLHHLQPLEMLRELLLQWHRPTHKVHTVGELGTCINRSEPLHYFAVALHCECLPLESELKVVCGVQLATLGWTPRLLRPALQPWHRPPPPTRMPPLSPLPKPLHVRPFIPAPHHVSLSEQLLLIFSNFHCLKLNQQSELKLVPCRGWLSQ